MMGDFKTSKHKKNSLSKTKTCNSSDPLHFLNSTAYVSALWFFIPSRQSMDVLISWWLIVHDSQILSQDGRINYDEFVTMMRKGNPDLVTNRRRKWAWCKLAYFGCLNHYWHMRVSILDHVLNLNISTSVEQSLLSEIVCGLSIRTRRNEIACHQFGMIWVFNLGCYLN